MKKIICLIVASMFLFVGCGDSGNESNNSDGSVNLEFYHMLTGGDGEYLDEIVENFNKDNDKNIVVTSNILKADEFSQKLAASVAAPDTLPDVVFIGEADIPLYADSIFTPIDDLMENANMSNDDYIESLFDLTKVNGSTYALPIQTFTWTLYYNNEMLESLGYTKSDVENLDLETMIQMCEEAMAQGDDYYGVSLSGADSAVFSRLLYTSIYQNGGDYFNPNDDKEILIGAPEVIEAIDKIKDLGKYTVPKGTAGRPPFVAGKVLFHFNGVWEISQLNNDEVKEVLDWDVVQFPNFFGNSDYGVWAGTHNMAITKAVKDDKEKEAAMEFIKYVSDNALILSKAGHIPAKKELLETDEFKNGLFSFFADNLDVFAIPPLGKTRDAVEKLGVPAFTDLYWGDKTDTKAVMEEVASGAAELIQ